MRRFVGVVALAVAAVACSSAKSDGGGGGGGGNNSSPDAGDGVTLMAGFNPGPAPDPSAGFQVIMPIVTDIEPGASDEYCTYTDYIPTEDTWVDASQGFQTETGHHVVFFYETTPQPQGTHICSNDEMTDFQFGMPASGGTSGEKFTMPGNLAVKLPKGSQLVVNHHYLNASATSVPQAQSALNVFYADPTIAHTPSSTMIIVDTNLTVPVGASKYTEDCTVNKTYQAWMTLPHMHNWGTHITVTDTPASTGVAQQLFDMDWDPDYAFDFNTVATQYSPSTPFLFNAGDKIHVECDYMNNTGAEMTFGDEMCVLAAFTEDPNNIGNVACDGGQWGAY
jgi:hypothetical protein